MGAAKAFFGSTRRRGGAVATMNEEASTASAEITMTPIPPRAEY